MSGGYAIAGASINTSLSSGQQYGNAPINWLPKKQKRKNMRKFKKLNVFQRILVGLAN